jgi:hypothetical protein
LEQFSLNKLQRLTFSAISDRIIPADETCGAAEAGSADFLLRLLNGELSEKQPLYLVGLDAIDRESQFRHHRAFAALRPTEQDALLREIESGQVKTTWAVSPAGFFQMLVEHVLEGFYADPGNGGNRDSVSWKMVGYRAEGSAP